MTLRRSGTAISGLDSSDQSPGSAEGKGSDSHGHLSLPASIAWQGDESSSPPRLVRRSVSSPMSTSSSPGLSASRTSSRSIYAAYDPAVNGRSSMRQRGSSAMDMSALQLAGMKHSPSTLDFVQETIDDRLTQKFLNRVPSWIDVGGAVEAGNGRSGSGGGANGASKSEAPRVRLGAIMNPLSDGVSCVVDDSFWRCFEDPDETPWNWNFYLFPAWIVGALVRYLILFPLRALALFIGVLVFTLGFFVVALWFSCPCVRGRTPEAQALAKRRRKSAEHGLVRWLASSFVLSWSGVIRYHGVRPSDRIQRRVFVCNHSSMIDAVMLLARDAYSLVGQAHKGWLAFVQNRMLASLDCVWFQRGEASDRRAVFSKLQQHVRNETGDVAPLLVFPEGTCVNTKHIIQFKKGVFQLDPDVAICPVAMKYNDIFVDGYWNSRRYSFGRHLFRLMTSWAVVCDVYYLEPQYRGPNETAVQFAKRVQIMIARRGNFMACDWDGYMKYWQPSARFKRARQLAFVRSLGWDVKTPRKETQQQQQQQQDEDSEKAGGGLRKRASAAHR